METASLSYTTPVAQMQVNLQTRETRSPSRSEGRCRSPHAVVRGTDCGQTPRALRSSLAAANAGGKTPADQPSEYVPNVPTSGAPAFSGPRAAPVAAASNDSAPRL